LRFMQRPASFRPPSPSRNQVAFRPSALTSPFLLCFTYLVFALFRPRPLSSPPPPSFPTPLSSVHLTVRGSPDVCLNLFLARGLALPSFVPRLLHRRDVTHEECAFPLGASFFLFRKIPIQKTQRGSNFDVPAPSILVGPANSPPLASLRWFQTFPPTLFRHESKLFVFCSKEFQLKQVPPPS